MTNITNEASAQGARWLLLIHAIPPKPDYFRVKVRRRLARLGALPLKNSVYVLPNGEEALEDFQWLARAIEAEGGEAMVCEATFIEGVDDEALAARLRGEEPVAGGSEAAGASARPRGATWVTREGIKVDRMASAWLIRRFIDPEARFRFVPAKGYRPAAGELRFDMFGGEYTHEGDRCTFETLVARFGLDDPALSAIAEMVHDIDCKDERYARPGTDGVALLVRGIVAAHAGDDARLARGTALFDDLHASLTRGP